MSVFGVSDFGILISGMVDFGIPVSVPAVPISSRGGNLRTT